MTYKLKDICHIQSGGTPSRANQNYYDSPDIAWAKIGDIDNEETLTSTEEFISEEGLKAIGNRIFNSGTLLLAIYGSTRGKSTISGIKLSCNQAILGIDSIDKKFLDNRYLKYWFDFNINEHLFKSKGGAQKNLNGDYIKNLSIDPPAIELQIKVVDTFMQIQSLVTKRKQGIQLLEEYRNNFFLKLFLENPKFTPQSKYWGLIEDVVQDSVYGTSKKANKDGKGIPVLRMNNITYQGGFDLTDLKWVEMDLAEKDKYEIKDGDVLFNRTNSKELVGKTAVWDQGSGYTYAGYFVKFILKDEKMSSNYFSAYLNSSFGKKILFNKGKSSGNQVNFSPPLLKTQKILIPPINLQKKYDEVHNNIKSQKKAYYKSLTLLNEFYQIFLYQTFSGIDIVKKDEIDMIIEDDIQLEIFLNTISASDFENDEQYNIAIEKLYKILNRTTTKNLSEPDNLKGIIQRLQDESIVLETNKEYKYRLRDESITD